LFFLPDCQQPAGADQIGRPGDQLEIRSARLDEHGNENEKLYHESGEAVHEVFPTECLMPSQSAPMTPARQLYRRRMAIEQDSASTRGTNHRTLHCISKPQPRSPLRIGGY
jgi:hypothetical protein